MRIEVNVTPEIIATSKGGCRDCPLAKGLHAAGYPEARVFSGEFALDGSVFKTHKLPPDAEAMREAWDACEPVSPKVFIFEVEG